MAQSKITVRPMHALKPHLSLSLPAIANSQMHARCMQRLHLEAPQEPAQRIRNTFAVRGDVRNIRLYKWPTPDLSDCIALQRKNV